MKNVSLGIFDPSLGIFDPARRRRNPEFFGWFSAKTPLGGAGRIAHVERVGLRALHSPSVELHVSQRELGNMAGGSRESVNKIF